MMPEFLFYANVVLLLRLPLLLRDHPAPPVMWQVKTAIEAACLLLFVPATPLWWLVGTSVVLNTLAAPGRRFLQPRPPHHLLMLLAHLLAISVVFAPAWGVTFRPFWFELAEPVRVSTALGGWLLRLGTPASGLALFGLLLAANESNLLIRWLLGFLALRPTEDTRGTITAMEYRRGRVIGLIERAMIYSFVLSGEFVAVGFVLAAKGFTRSRDLKVDDRDFTEYVIIGTLLSVGLAMALAALVRTGLPG